MACRPVAVVIMRVHKYAQVLNCTLTHTIYHIKLCDILYV